MRTWNEKLYLDAMPGRKKPGRPRGDFGLWLQEMAENRIKTIVCLAPEAQIAAESPEYAQWRSGHTGASGGKQFELIDIPVDDYHAPEPFVAARFWKAAGDVAERIQAGERVFVHCAAGIGRTGMFAVAVLMQQGSSYEDAYRAINAVGSYPEVPAQKEFLKRGSTQKPTRIWGLDLAGLGGRNNTGLAMIETRSTVEEQMVVTVFEKHPFSHAFKGTDRWDNEQIHELIVCLQRWTDGENHLYVDIPIDLQGLPRVRNPLFVWQTKLRVVDYVFGGLPPFATFIGSQTADFHFLAAQADVLGRLGTSLFETYPKATIESVVRSDVPYKGKNATAKGRIEIQRLLGISNPSEKLNDDEIDAIICVLPGVGRPHSLTENDLTHRWNRLLNERTDDRTIRTERPCFFTPPAGYRVLPGDDKWRAPKLSLEKREWSNCEMV